MSAEGWYLDPFGLHEARWISDGSPTALVRDGGVESQDTPPHPTVDGPLQPVPHDEPADGEDLLRAGSADPGDQIFDPNAAMGAAWDGFGQSGGD